MKKNIVTVAPKEYIDIIDTDKIIGTSYNKKSKSFTIYFDRYEFGYDIKDFKDEADFYNTMNSIKKAMMNN